MHGMIFDQKSKTPIVNIETVHQNASVDEEIWVILARLIIVPETQYREDIQLTSVKNIFCILDCVEV